MQPEQPNTPSQGVESAPDAVAAEPVSDEPKEGSSPHWWDRLLNRRTTEAPNDGGELGTDGQASSKLTLTQEELDRRIQAETDRREAKRLQEARAAERRKLRDEDPWQFAQREREAEQQQQQTQGLASFFADIGTQHDRVAIDPLMEMLPMSERERIMKLEGAGVGLQGRNLIVREALKSLQKQAQTQAERDAEAKLRRNPAFRKQVLSESRQGFADPDLLPASAPSASDKKVADILRDYYGVGGARHNTAG
jgi:hypothetical protein